MSNEKLFDVFVDQYAQSFLSIPVHSFGFTYNRAGHRLFRLDLLPEYPGLVCFEFRVGDDAAMNFFIFSNELLHIHESLMKATQKWADFIFCDVVVYERPASMRVDAVSLHNQLISEGYEGVSDFYSPFKDSDKGIEIYADIYEALENLKERIPRIIDLYIQAKEDICNRYGISFTELNKYLEPSPMTEYKRYMDIGWLN